jgi:hypothetical protein
VKVNYLTLLAGATIMLLNVAATHADDKAASALAADAASVPPAASTTASVAPAPPAEEDTATYNDDTDPVRDFIVRAGAWGVHQSGNPAKVDEYQSRFSSPFWNADGIWSNGDQTIDFSATGTDDFDQDGRLHFYGGPRLEADLYYEEFPHQLDAKTYPGWLKTSASPPVSNVNGPGFNVFSRQDMNPGQDYAIQVQEFKANFKGDITENLRWRVNVFGIDKEGFRQANAFTHCFSAQVANTTNSVSGTPLQYWSGTPNNTATRQCHAVSQAQHIDWQTTEMDAGLELKIDCNTTLAYSHLVRSFTQNDQQVYNAYRFSANPGNPGQLGYGIYVPNGGVAAGTGAYAMAGYNIVPDSETQIDRVKFSTSIGCDTDAYLLGYVGYNEDMLRFTYRNFNGTDLRITNRSLEHWAITGYGKYYREESTSPLVPLNTLYPSPAQKQFYQESNLNFITDPLVTREVHGFGVDGRWRPFEDECDTIRRNLSFTVGYDYNELLYENAGDTLGFVPPAANNGVFVVNGVFTQPNTIANTFSFGMEEKWSKTFDTQLRYKYISTQYPLYGITPDAGQSINAGLNSALPTQENRLEFECTWTPTDCLMVNATIYVENAMSNAPYVGNTVFPGWTSNSVPFTLSGWWAPTCDWSFNVGFSEMDSWINQGVNAGPLNSSADGINIPWAFRGTADVFTIGGRYQATCKLSFNGMFEYVHGINSSFAVVPSAAQTPPTGAPYDLGQWSLVKEQSFRFECGADYLLRPRVTTYVRYDYYDFQDLSTGLLNGTQNSILGGVSATF